MATGEPPTGGDRFEDLAAALVRVAARRGTALTVDQARDLLWEAGVGDLIEDLAVARAVIRAADGFHPVSRFFADNSAERELILRILSDS